MKIPKYFTGGGASDTPFNNATGVGGTTVNYIVPIDWDVEDITEIAWEVDDY